MLQSIPPVSLAVMLPPIQRAKPADRTITRSSWLFGVVTRAVRGRFARCVSGSYYNQSPTRPRLTTTGRDIARTSLAIRLPVSTGQGSFPDRSSAYRAEWVLIRPTGDSYHLATIRFAAVIYCEIGAKAPIIPNLAGGWASVVDPVLSIRACGG